jgi:hypothetical protein
MPLDEEDELAAWTPASRELVAAILGAAEAWVTPTLAACPAGAGRSTPVARIGGCWALAIVAASAQPTSRHAIFMVTP